MRIVKVTGKVEYVELGPLEPGEIAQLIALEIHTQLPPELH